MSPYRRTGRFLSPLTLWLLHAAAIIALAATGYALGFGAITHALASAVAQ